MINIIKKNQILEVKISDVTSAGDGVAKVDDYPIFVNGGVTGDVLNITVTKTNKTYGFGRINEIISPSPHRVSPPCPVFQSCGGCDLMHISYPHQLKIKQDTVTGNLQRIASLHPDRYEFDGIIGAKSTLGYRSKSQLPVGKKHADVVLGFYKKGSHDIAVCSNCLIQNETINKAAKIFIKYANKNKLTVYNEKNHKGILRHLYIRIGHGTGEMLLTIVTNSREALPDTEWLIESLRACSELKGLIQNINTKKTNLILGEENRILWGENSITSMIDNLKFRISAESFFQINGEQTEKLYAKALEYASLTGNETVFDLYCGVGSISLFLASKAQKVIGVEIVEKAIENAKENAALNGIDNAYFYSGDCAEIVENLISQGESADVVVVDPPRKGCSEQLLNFLNKISPEKIVYVSCNSATLARDVKILDGYGYKLTRVCAVDMFPQSGHIESVALLVRADSEI
ncbi:MAG: 23S rRNA (uracil(1939)-C(5))-methyltransferase RlmD [Clostridia bacterium]|nr:23S rRNA (uracil(1939)-C(5))-methyltransferase RlmD [Clostridia bacterium]